MRRFEEQYRLNEGDDVLNRENAIHQDVDLRLDAVEQDAEAFRAGNRADIEAILKSLEQTFGTLAAEMRGLLDQASGGLSADIIVETTAKYFLTDARRAAILSDLRGGVDASGDTMAKLLAVIVGGAPAGRQTLKAINDAVVANTATLTAITGGADPTLDSFAEALTRFVIDEGQISGLMTMVGNRLRGDAPGSYTDGQIAQFLANLGIGQLTFGQCRFAYASPTQCTLNAVNGGLLAVNGAIRVVPAGGIPFANTLPGGAALAGSTRYYAYVYWSGGAWAREFSTTAYVLDGKGFPVKAGDASRTCVGMVYTDASGQFIDSAAARQVLSYFNKRKRFFNGGLAFGSQTSSTSFVAIGSTRPVLCWDGDCVEFTIYGTVVNSAAGAQTCIQAGFDGAPIAQDCSPGMPTGASASSASVTSIVGPAEGLHTVSFFGKAGSGLGTFYIAVSGSVDG